MACAQTSAPVLISQKCNADPPTSNCQVGQLCFDTAAAAGSNIYACTSQNVWTLSSGGGGGSGTVTSVLATTPLQSDGSTTTPTISIVASGVPLNKLATQGANTITGNGTGSTAVPTALSIGSCSGASNALIWTSGTGFGCNTIAGGGSVSITSANGGIAVSPSPLTGTGTVDLSNVAATSHQFFTSVAGNVFVKAQPACADLSDAVSLCNSNVGTNLTGTASGLTAGNVTTNANLTGPIISSGNATSVAVQTGTGSTFVMNTAPTISAPVLTGLVTATSVEDSITAHATGGQASAFALSATANYHRVSTVATAGDSVKLPASSIGQSHYIANSGAAALQVYGSGTDTINSVATATGVGQDATQGVWYVCTSSGNWTTSVKSIKANSANVTVTISAAGTYLLDTAQGVQTTSTPRFAGIGLGVASAANGIKLPNGVLISTTAPTIGSGFGISPSVPNNNGTAVFTVNVGTGGTATSGVVTMPAATTGWACTASPTSSPQAGAQTDSAPTSTTSITLTNYTLATGVALAWPASTVLEVICSGY